MPTWASWLTSRRLRVHGLILALCMTAASLWMFSNAGLVGRNGVLKGADFLHFYTLGTLALEHRGGELYDMAAQSRVAEQRVPQAGRLFFVPLYGPQVSLLFAPLATLSYGWALVLWELLNVAIYAFSIYSVWRHCPGLRSEGLTIFILALGYPAFFHLLAWGQTSAIALACFTVSFLELRAGRLFTAGLAIGCLAFKPQLGIAAAFIFLLGRQWRVVAGAVMAGLAQMLAAWFYYGTDVMRDYARHLLNVADVFASLEPRPYQMHGLRSFWAMLLPWPHLAFGAYVVTGLLVLIACLRCWKSGAPLSAKFAGLLLATVLVSPHLTVYDLVILAPAILLASDWALGTAGPERASVGLLLYACYVFPLFGPVSHWTHLQLSVPAMAALLWTLQHFVERSTGVSSPQEVAVA